MVRTGTARRRQRRTAIPRFPRKSGVELNPTAEQDYRQEAVHINEPAVGDDGGDVDAKEPAGPGAIETIDAVDDSRVRVREALDQGSGKEEVLGRTRPTTLSQHGTDGAITRTTVGQIANRLNELPRAK